MYAYRLSKLTFNDETELRPGKLTIVCGPNNVGKSRILKEIAVISSSSDPPPTVLVRDVKHVLPDSLDELRQAYSFHRYFEDRGWRGRCLAPNLCSEWSFSGGGAWPDHYAGLISRRDQNRERTFASNFGSDLLAHLTTEHRLQLVKESPSASHEQEVSNMLQALYEGGARAEKLVRDEVERAFALQVALDFSAPRTLVLRVGADFSKLPPDPREAKPVLMRHEKLDDQGDGLRAFVGIIVAILAVNRGVFLIDEPETFLHPPQAFRIGQFLANHADESRQLVVATHSVDFLRGVLNQTRDVTVIRVDRTDDQNSFLRLEPTTLERMATDPLLSSARVLDGLFYTGALVVEADRDARFYQAVFKKRFPDVDLHFVNADNKQTVSKIIRLYRDLVVRCSGIVDFDVLNDARDFESMLDGLAMDEPNKRAALALRGNIGAEAKEVPAEERFAAATSKIEVLSAEARACAANLKDDLAPFLSALDAKCRDIAEAAKGWRELKQKGICALSESAQAEFWKLYDLCTQVGLMITPTGELESMLIDYAIERTTDKRGWISRALKLIPGLELDDAKNPWKFAVSVHDTLRVNKTA